MKMSAPHLIAAMLAYILSISTALALDLPPPNADNNAYFGDVHVRIQAFAGILRDMSTGKTDPQLTDTTLARSVWAEIVRAADANYTPGKFTTFAGFEWTSNPQKRNLHPVYIYCRDAGHPRY